MGDCYYRLNQKRFLLGTVPKKAVVQIRVLQHLNKNKCPPKYPYVLFPIAHNDMVHNDLISNIQIQLHKQGSLSVNISLAIYEQIH